MPSRGAVDATVNTQGLRDLQRDLKKVSPELAKQLRVDLKDVASEVARGVNSRLNASSFRYIGTSTTRGAAIRSTGAKPHVARFIDVGFHPRGGATFVPGRETVNAVIESQQDQIIEGIGQSIDRAMDSQLKT